MREVGRRREVGVVDDDEARGGAHDSEGEGVVSSTQGRGRHCLLRMGVADLGGRGAGGRKCEGTIANVYPFPIFLATKFEQVATSFHCPSQRQPSPRSPTRQAEHPYIH